MQRTVSEAEALLAKQRQIQDAITTTKRELTAVESAVNAAKGVYSTSLSNRVLGLVDDSAVAKSAQSLADAEGNRERVQLTLDGLRTSLVNRDTETRLTALEKQIGDALIPLSGAVVSAWRERYVKARAEFEQIVLEGAALQHLSGHRIVARSATA